MQYFERLKFFENVIFVLSCSVSSLEGSTSTMKDLLTTESQLTYLTKVAGFLRTRNHLWLIGQSWNKF